MKVLWKAETGGEKKKDSLDMYLYIVNLIKFVILTVVIHIRYDRYTLLL